MEKLDKNSGWPGFFRIFTVYCAILLWTSAAGQSMAGPGDLLIMHTYQGLTTWAVPALFMLWGMYALEGTKAGFSANMLGRVLPACGVLIFWGAFYAVADQLLYVGELNLHGLWSALAAAARGDTFFHVKILYPLIGLYLVQPVIQRFTSTATRSEAVYFLVLCFLFANVLPMWTEFHPDSVIADLLELLGVHMVLGWVGLFAGGWYLRHYVIGRVTEFILYGLGLLGLVLTLGGDSFFGGGRELWCSYTAPNVVLTAAAFCALFRYVLGVSDERSRRSAVSRLGGYSFGIYMVHQLWVLIFHWLRIPFHFPVVIGIPFFALVLFLLSLPLAWLLHRIPVVGNYLT